MNDEVISLFPTDESGNRSKRFEVKMRKRNDGTIEKAVFIDDELLDWSIDMNSLMEAMKMGPKFFQAAQKDIERHFTESVSEFIGRKININEIKKAIQTGWI